ncbi:MAG: metallophosphoesterase [Gemmatimonadetes bacterium]|nr:metallophosphoesterase [Gemmatimonadota bacterium]
MWFFFLFLIGLPTSIAAVRILSALFPRRTARVWVGFGVGNALVLAVPLAVVEWETPFEMARVALGGPFVAWQLFALAYTGLTLVACLFYLPLRCLGWVRAGWPPFWRRPTWFLLGAFAAVLPIGFHQAVVPLETRVVPMAFTDLPAGLDGYRIALFSDLHVSFFTRESRLRQIVEAVRRLRPDMVIVAGDLVDDAPHYIPKVVRGLRELRARDGVFAVLGNHEMYGGAAEHLVGRADLPFRVLVNEAVRVERPGASLALLGLGEPHADRSEFRPDWPRALAGTRPGDFVVAAAHRPSAFAEARRHGVALTLAGHAHGGQAGVRRWGWSLAGLFLPWHMGRYEEGGSVLYVTTGVGYWMLPVRLGVPPEVVLIELRREPG